MEDRATTFRKQSIALLVPAVNQERAFRVKVPVALVAFHRFFSDIRRAEIKWVNCRHCTAFLLACQFPFRLVGPRNSKNITDQIV